MVKEGRIVDENGCDNFIWLRVDEFDNYYLAEEIPESPEKTALRNKLESLQKQVLEVKLELNNTK